MPTKGFYKAFVCKPRYLIIVRIVFVPTDLANFIIFAIYLH